MERTGSDRPRMDGTRSAAAGGASPVDEGAVVGEAPIAADVAMPTTETQPVDAPDPREAEGGLAPGLRDRAGVATDAATDTVVGSGAPGTTAGSAAAGTTTGLDFAGEEKWPIGMVREGMKVVDAAGEEIGKVDFVKMGDPEAAGVSPADAPHEGGLLTAVADAFAPPPEDELPKSVADEMLRVGYVRIDAKGWFAKDRFVPADAIAGVSGDTVHLSVTKDELAEA
jgi:hypothetical protein